MMVTHDKINFVALYEELHLEGTENEVTPCSSSPAVRMDKTLIM
jgi:hypothetical protein